jgi:hypothetical protein
MNGGYIGAIHMAEHPSSELCIFEQMAVNLNPFSDDWNHPNCSTDDNHR